MLSYFTSGGNNTQLQANQTREVLGEWPELSKVLLLYVSESHPEVVRIKRIIWRTCYRRRMFLFAIFLVDPSSHCNWKNLLRVYEKEKPEKLLLSKREKTYCKHDER